jgi:hypothetical protein
MYRLIQTKRPNYETLALHTDILWAGLSDNDDGQPGTAALQMAGNNKPCASCAPHAPHHFRAMADRAGHSFKPH